jgi:magnesium transporter
MTGPSSGTAVAQPAGAPGTVRVTAWRAGSAWEADGLEEGERLLADPGVRLWVDVSVDDHANAAAAARLLGLHPLIVEDIAERNQRAKLEETDGQLHLVLFALAYAGEVHELEVDLVLGERTLLTVHDPGWDPFLLPQLRGGAGHLLGRGPDFLLHALADGIVDAYFPVLDRLGDELDAVQDDVIAHATPWTLERLFALKRELITLRRAVAPAREIFNQLTNRDLALIAPAHVVYFRDVYDHLIRATDELDTDRELVGGTLEVYLSTINNNLSTIMKRLTGVTVILAGMGAMAGIFGMSEAGTALAFAEAGGFWLVTAVIVSGAAVTALVLRRIDWI